MQASIKTFFAQKSPVPPNTVSLSKTFYQKVADEPVLSSKASRREPTAQNVTARDDVFVFSDTECQVYAKPRASQKKRKVISPQNKATNSGVYQRQAFSSMQEQENSLDVFTTLSEGSVSDYVSRHLRILRNVLHTRSAEELEKMMIKTLVLPKKPNQLWTKKFANSRCLNLDVDDLIRSWMRTFIRRRPLDLNDDVVALLEGYRVKSSLERQRDKQFIVNDSDDDEIPLCRVLVLKGPVGSGKTSAIHSCLYALNEDKNGVIEVNTSQRRRQADFVNRFKEATQSQWIAEMSSAKAKPKSRLKSTTDKRKSRTPASVRNKHAVILIDDVDVAVEDDAGFSKGVAYMLKDTRRPIVLTCVNLPRGIQPLLSNGYYNFCLLDQNENSMVSFLLSVAIAQGALALPSDADLRCCIGLLRCDLRAILNHLQFWLDVSREHLIQAVQKNEELSCLTAPRISLYHYVAGFSNFRLESMWSGDDFAHRTRFVRHGLESELFNIIHENYTKLSCDNDNDRCNLQGVTNFANMAESLSAADLITSYRNPCPELHLHSRIISCTSELLCECYNGLICNTSRSMDLHELRLLSFQKDSAQQLISSIWGAFFETNPSMKHLPTSLSFAVDQMSAIRSISFLQHQNKLLSGRRTRRFQHYLKNTLSQDGLETLEKYCSTLYTQPSTVN